MNEKNKISHRGKAIDALNPQTKRKKIYLGETAGPIC
ncbi:MAG: hypothetical protein U5N56_04340 [Candidatus Marinimicrobia bacterium]|nr:hypothetical protein [Candidatus Neomarinimicrobiota bacterium]